MLSSCSGTAPAPEVLSLDQGAQVPFEHFKSCAMQSLQLGNEVTLLRRRQLEVIAMKVSLESCNRPQEGHSFFVPFCISQSPYFSHVNQEPRPVPLHLLPIAGRGKRGVVHSHSAQSGLFFRATCGGSHPPAEHFASKHWLVLTLRTTEKDFYHFSDVVGESKS